MRLSLRLAAALFCAAPAMAQVLDVPGSYPTIQAALDATAAGDTVLVQPGTYHEALVFPSRNIALASAGGAALTTIDASGLGQRVITIDPDFPATISVTGFTITGGSATDGEGRGGGLLITLGHVTVQGCVVTGNTAGLPTSTDAQGGGLWSSAAPKLIDCQFLDNHQIGGGGGGGVAGLLISATNCLFAGNTAQGSGGGGYDGAMGGAWVGCRFEGNVAAQDGGGLALKSDNATLEDCRFTGNVAGGEGGGLWRRDTGAILTLTVLSRCSFIGNQASSGGGARLVSQAGFGVGYLSAIDCVFSQNAAATGDGLLATATPTAITCLRFCTFDGDGLVTTNELSVDHCILRGPWGGPPLVSLAGGPISVSWSDVEGGWPGVGNFDADPLFADPASGDGHLSLASPCVDAGNPNYVAGQGGFGCEGPAVDRDGQPRVQHGRVDVGADESEPDCNGNGLGDLHDIAAGTSADCDANGLPDECEPLADCNGNGVKDGCDIASGLSTDCNGNGVPDECEPLDDCNGNGTPDICDLGNGTSHDCNGNGVPDECDIASGASLDADGDGFPDECTTLLQVPAEYPTIQAAIAAAGDADVIELAPGEWGAAGFVELDFLGKVLTLRGAGGAAATILDGGGDKQIAHLGAAESGGITLRGLTLRGGVGSLGGAVGVDEGGRLLAEDCVFAGNIAVHGGAVFVRGGSSATLRRCTFAGNRAETGGALRFSEAEGLVEHCTFEGNEAEQKGGSLHAQAGSQVVVVDSILHGGKAQIGMELSLQGVGTLLTISYSDLAGGQDGIALGHHVWGPGMIEAAPLFANPAAGDFHLLPGSPCINSGDPAGPADPDGSPPDMGALSYEPWTTLGGGIAGSFGLPLLVANGPLTPDSQVHWSLSHGAPGEGFLLVVGFAQAALPFQGGVLWPVPHALASLVFDHAGGSAGKGRWPPGAPAGTGVWLQAWFADDGAAQGLAASDGVRGLSP